MQQTRRSSVPQAPSTDGAHSPSEGSPTVTSQGAKGTRKAVSSSPAKAKSKRAASPSKGSRGAAALSDKTPSTPATPKGPQSSAQAGEHQTTLAANPEPGSAFPQALATTQAPSPAWSLLPLPAERFKGWIASLPSEDDALNELCDHIVEGKSLLAFCRERGFTYSYVRAWIEDERAPHRSANYARAREDRADVFADEQLEIVDSIPRSRSIDPETGVVTETLEASAVQEAKLRAESRRWVAARMKPRVYGEKLALGGADGLDPIKQEVVQHTVTFVAPAVVAPLVEEVSPAFPAIEGGS